MPLFEQRASEIVKPEDIKDFTGVKPEDFGFEKEAELDTVLTAAINRIASHMYARLKRQVLATDEEYLAIQDILIRTVAKSVAVAIQQRTSPIVQTDDFTIGVINTAEVIKDLNEELRPFMKRGRVNVFWSSQGSEEE